MTARLSRQFYEKLGDEVANELVDWLNQVDAQYKSELRELAESYFERFRAELRAEMGTIRAELDSKLDSRTATLRAELGGETAALGGEIAALRGGMATLKAEVRSEISGLRAELLKWMFLFWAGNVAATVGIVFAAIKLSH